MTINAPTHRQIPQLRRLWQQAFGDTDVFLDCFFSIAFSPDRCRCICVDGKIVAAHYWFDCSWDEKKIAYLYAVATDKAFQNRGLCSALMEDTHRHLESLGYEGAILVPGSRELFRFYEKRGYWTATCIREFSCTAGATPVSVRPVGAAEFAALRRQLLPEGSVLQEGSALSLLESQGALFGGDNFLMVAARDGDNLICSELLGPVDAAPGILAAFGAASGRFRTLGGNTPFSMYLPLQENTAVPAYFGLALD